MVDTSTFPFLLLQAIESNKRPSVIFYEFIRSGSIEANYLTNTLRSNKEVIRIITSPAGRAWLKRHMDDFLNYLAKF